VHHQLRAGASERLVEGVGVAGIERQIEGRLRVHLRRADGIEAFRRLAVAFADLGSEVSRPAADRIGLQESEAAGAVLLPDLEFGLLLEDPDQHRRLQVHVLRDHVGDQFRRTGWLALALLASEISSLLQPASTRPAASAAEVMSARIGERQINAKLHTQRAISRPNTASMP